VHLFNTIAVFDVYMVANSPEAARDTLIKGIACGDIKPSECTATESKFERSIRTGYRDERPFVASDISDSDFQKLKGKTTIQAFEMFYSKRG